MKIYIFFNEICLLSLAFDSCNLIIFFTENLIEPSLLNGEMNLQGAKT